METPCRNGADPTGQPGVVPGGVALDECAVPDLAVHVVTPALHPAGGGQGAGVIGSHRNGADAAGEPADVHGRVALDGRAVADLAVGVVAPALDAAAGGQGAGVEVAGCDGADAAGEPADVHGCETLGGGAIAQPATAVVAPALDAAAGGQGAGVIHARCDRNHPAGQPGHVGGCGAVNGRVIAELAVAVAAPALDPAAGGQGAGVGPSRPD